MPADTDLMEREADTDARRKIQFSVPSPVPTQLDPRQVEMVRMHADNVGAGDGVRGRWARIWVMLLFWDHHQWSESRLCSLKQFLLSQKHIWHVTFTCKPQHCLTFSEKNWAEMNHASNLLWLLNQKVSVARFKARHSRLSDSYITSLSRLCKVQYVESGICQWAAGYGQHWD